MLSNILLTVNLQENSRHSDYSKTINQIYDTLVHWLLAISD